MRRFVPAMLLAWSQLHAQDVLSLELPVRQVRLLPREAYVTRKASVHLPKSGLYRFQMTGLPEGLKLDELRCKVEGPGQARLGSMSLKKVHRPERNVPEWYQSLEEGKKIQAVELQLENRERVLRQAQTLFDSLSTRQFRNAQAALSRGALSLVALNELMAEFETRKVELLREKTQLETERKQLSARKSALEVQQQGLRKRFAERPTRLHLELETDREGEVEISLAYPSPKASWTASYEARLRDDRTSLELQLVATVRQTTDEDWKEVEVELATQGATRILATPKLPSSVRLHHVPGEANWSPTPSRSSSHVSLPMAIPRIPGKVALEKGKERKFRVTSVDLDPQFRYLALPRQSPRVFQIAEVQLPADFPLLEGSTVVLSQGLDRVGQQSLSLPVPGEALRLGFGAVSGLKATLSEAKPGFHEVGQKNRLREWTHEETLTLSNELDRSLELEVQDRCILSSTDSIQVEDESTPGWRELQPGQRSWLVQLPSQEKKTLKLATRIRGPLVGTVLNAQGLIQEGNN